jgi:hypothetical protein
MVFNMDDGMEDEIKKWIDAIVTEMFTFLGRL